MRETPNAADKLSGSLSDKNRISYRRSAMGEILHTAHGLRNAINDPEREREKEGKDFSAGLHCAFSQSGFETRWYWYAWH